MILDIILLIMKLIMKFDNGINNKTCWAATIIGDNIALRLADDNRNIDADNDLIMKLIMKITLRQIVMIVEEQIIERNYESKRINRTD